jgi:LysR family transcriptional regulator, nitrogen assimilation regulatory protein
MNIGRVSMDLKQLECFVRVAELGSFTKAAAVLGISQPVLSRQVRQLELELKKHLLYRNGRGVTPTESGRRLVAHGNGILHQVELARQELEDEEAFPVGKVVVGLPPTIGKALTVHLVTGFRKLYPKAAIHIVEGLTASMQERLQIGRLDIALLYNPVATPQLEFEPLRAEDLYLISRASTRKLPDKVRMGDLPLYPLIIPSRPNSIRSLVETECGRQGVALNIALEIDAIASVLDLVEQHAGHAILTRAALHGRPANVLHAARIISPGIATQLVIATSTQRPLTTLARRAVALIKSEIAAQGASRAPIQSRNFGDGKK